MKYLLAILLVLSGCVTRRIEIVTQPCVAAFADIDGKVAAELRGDR